MRKQSGSSNMPFRRPMVFLVCFALVGLPVILWLRSALTGSSSTPSDPLGFIPTSVSNGKKKMKCEELFEGTDAKDFVNTDLYEQSISHYVQASNAVKQGNIKTITYDVPNETPLLYKTLHYIAVYSNASVACVAGFNLGQAAFSLLTANKHMVVHAFRRSSAGEHSQKMEKYLNNKFNNKLFVYDGDTVETIPRFIAMNIKRLRCDIMLITGPLDYHKTKAELTNFAHIANTARNHIVFADHLGDLVKTSAGGAERAQSDKIAGRKWAVDAWEEGCSSGMVSKKMHCSFTTTTRVAENNPYIGFGVGVIRRGPDARDGLAGPLGQTKQPGQVKGKRFRKKKNRTTSNRTTTLFKLSTKPTV